MVDKYTALLHYFFQRVVAQLIGCVSATAHQNKVNWKAHAFGAYRQVITFLVKALSTNVQGVLTVHVTEPSRAMALTELERKHFEKALVNFMVRRQPAQHIHE